MSQNNQISPIKPNILVVDDDPAILMLLKRTLSREGYQVNVASNGEEGLAKAKQIHPAMVICDWLMPKIDGLEVCRQIKAIPELATTFFILLTSLKSVEDRIKGLDAGSDEFLSKPIDIYELNARVRAGLRLHQLSNDLKTQKQLLEAELAEAAEYVNSILPEPLQEPSVSIDVRFIPSRQLGGDSFDYYWLDADHLVIYLLDVSGHGLRAALPSLSVVNLLRSQALSNVDYAQPSDVLRRLNETFQMDQRNDKYFTIWYGVYNQRKKELVYSSGGHPPAILFSKDLQGKLTEKKLKTRGLPIAMFPHTEYTDFHCAITTDVNLYLFSDGVYEIKQTDGTILGLEEFINLLKKHTEQQSTNLDLLLEELKVHNSDSNFGDDLSIMQIKFSNHLSS